MTMNKKMSKNLVHKDNEILTEGQHQIFDQCKDELEYDEFTEFDNFMSELCRLIFEAAMLIDKQDPTVLERMQFGCVLGVQTACSVDRLVHTEYNIDELKEGINE